MGDLDRVLHRLVKDPAFRLEVVNDPEQVLSAQGLTDIEVALAVRWLFSKSAQDPAD